MRFILTAIVSVGASACGVVPQPESMSTVAAFEVPLPAPSDRDHFLAVLRKVAQSEGMHVDAESSEDLEQGGNVDPAFRMTMNAAVWKGQQDEEPIASAMDQPDHLGQVWLTFFKGTTPSLNRTFRDAAMREIMRSWPDTLSLPITPTGAIPLRRDLIRTPKGYVVNPAMASKYQLPSDAAHAR